MKPPTRMSISVLSDVPSVSCGPAKKPSVCDAELGASDPRTDGLTPGKQKQFITSPLPGGEGALAHYTYPFTLAAVMYSGSFHHFSISKSSATALAQMYPGPKRTIPPGATQAPPRYRFFTGVLY